MESSSELYKWMEAGKRDVTSLLGMASCKHHCIPIVLVARLPLREVHTSSLPSCRAGRGGGGTLG